MGRVPETARSIVDFARATNAIIVTRPLTLHGHESTPLILPPTQDDDWEMVHVDVFHGAAWRWKDPKVEGGDGENAHARGTRDGQ